MGGESDFVNGLVSGGIIGLISFAIIYLITTITSMIHELLATSTKEPGIIFFVSLLILAIAFVIVFWIRLVRFIHRHTFVKEL